MDYRKTCFSCMEELSKIDSICEHCGYDNQIRSNGIGYLAGGLLGNQYIVGKALGRGGFGITYLGYDTGLQRKVAIKEYFPSDLCIRDPNTQDLHSLDKESDNAFEKGKQRALREARLTARIDNIPNVVRTYGVLEAHNTVYIIMEYIDGMTLSRFAQQQSGKLSWIRAWALIKPIMMTLGEVHKRGVVHKDISPENIMIRYSDGMPVLLDFGAAQNATTGNTEHSVNINAGYAPLEAFSTMGVQDGRTDEYSLMATLYYLLTGKKPASPLNVLSGIENVVPPSRLGADISSETEAVLLKGMSVRIEERYATMGELAEAFEKAGRTAGTIAYSDEQLKDIASKGVQNQSDKKRGTNKQRIIVPIVVILIALAVFVLFMLNGGKNKDVQSSQITLNTVEPTPALTPTPEPTPELTPEPTPEPTPELTPEQTPEPTPELTLEPTLEPTLQVDVTFEGENKLSELEVGSYITFGSYEQDNDFSNGKESIEWLVLDYDVVNNRALLLSRYGLDAKPYNSSFSKVTWETCTLRSWLNEEFLNEAFSTKERSSILMTSVDNSFAQVYSEFRSSGGNNTQDRIFLLSCAEANKYLNVTDMGENNTKSRMAPTAYAIKEGASTDSNYETNDGGVTGWWWLRSPGRSQRYAASVSRGGSLLYSGVSLGSGCVRPALWVNLDSLDQEQTSKLIDVTEIAAESTPTPTLTSIKTISSEQELLDYFPQITKVTRESGMFIDEIRIEFNQKIAVA
ncbi:MAG: serine/threonine protein kinase, partial [Clostridia bacterium]|nr:serine/threonine protein kinase [Clostridia bacterium]